jgi:hypothetical protein
LLWPLPLPVRFVLAPTTPPNKPCQHKGAEPSSTQAFGIDRHTGVDACLHEPMQPRSPPTRPFTRTHSLTLSDTHTHTHTLPHSLLVQSRTRTLHHNHNHNHSQKHIRRAHSFMHVPSHSHVHRPRKAACRTNERLQLMLLSGTRPLCHPQSSAPRRGWNSRLPLSPLSK